VKEREPYWSLGATLNMDA